MKTTIQGLPYPLGGLKSFGEMDRRSGIEVAVVTVWGICILLLLLRQLKIRFLSAAAFAKAHCVNQETGLASHKVIIGCLAGSFRQICLPMNSLSLNVWSMMLLGGWVAQAVGIILLIQYSVEFNGEMMDTAAPYYDVYDDTYSDANFVLARKVSGRTHK